MTDDEAKAILARMPPRAPTVDQASQMRRAIKIAEPTTRRFEGKRNKPYRDVANVLTCGIGHTGPDVREGETWSEERIERTFQDDMWNAGLGVLRVVVWNVPLTDTQFAALLDFTFNFGAVRLVQLTSHGLLGGDYASIPRELPKWVHAGGQVESGLVARRNVEIDLWRFGGLGIAQVAVQPRPPAGPLGASAAHLLNAPATEGA